ncbi:MAG: MtnX-like HAD-IB family phosphatase [Melioribacteraceae bacterium]
MINSFKIFVDFDGTITKTDVGEHLFLEFGDAEKCKLIVQDWIDKKITSKDTWQLMCNTIENPDIKKMNEFLDTIEVDETFFSFVKYFRDAGSDINILSDGLDYYISHIVKKSFTEEVPIYSNKLEFIDNKMIPQFPYGDEECKFCANCKRNHILNLSGDEDFTVYIGDGYSDTCPAQFCDFIFAKNSLLKYCEINRITYFPYNDFDDVSKKLIELSGKKRLKKRHQSVLKRKEVYSQG